jgi:PAS domain S-box-containing protein
MNICGYKIFDLIYESENSLIYRGMRLQDGQFAILKVLKQDYPDRSSLARYKQEYEILKNLNLKGAIEVYGLEQYQRTPVLILEDFGGQSLKQFTLNAGGSFLEVLRSLKPSRVDDVLQIFIKLAIQLAEIVGEIHSANIIHKDINPSNIIYNPELDRIKLIDFGISTRFNRENTKSQKTENLEGTVAYISPEQTGRMSRFLDYRSDFYSLGVTLYELLTGNLPFNTSNSIELVHCHIAQPPVPLHQIRPDLPKPISDIVMKLMAKMAEERYQSAWGLQTDLMCCLTQLEERNSIAEFTIGERDLPEKLQLPQKNYDRDRELNVLLKLFYDLNNEAQKTCKLLMISGEAGLGKSTLVSEFHQKIVTHNACFVEYKIRKSNLDCPYSTIINLCQALVHHILIESQAKLEVFKEKLSITLGNHIQLAIEIIPDLALIFDRAVSATPVEPQEFQYRTSRVLYQLIDLFSHLQFPLVLFLDDLHWADAASLRFIEHLTIGTKLDLSSQLYGQSSTASLFLICAYDSQNVSFDCPLIKLLENLQDEGIECPQIVLNPLSVKAINQLLTDTLYQPALAVQPLADVIFRKTAGYPAFINEFLKKLYLDCCIYFNIESRTWEWDLAQIETQEITDNVIDLLILQVQKLPESTQSVLRIAACFGYEFDLDILSAFCERSPLELFSDLTQAMQAELIVPTSELDNRLLVQTYRFQHDRVLQAVRCPISDTQQQSIHLKIGYFLLENTTALEEDIFEIVNHLNEGISLLDKRQDLLQIARLNIVAGEKAKVTHTYEASVRYFNLALYLVRQESWQENYSFMLDLYTKATEASYFNANSEQTKVLIELALEQARSILDRLKFYEIRIKLYILQHQERLAIETGLDVLSQLGISVSDTVSQDLEHLNIDCLPPATATADPVELAALKISTLICIPAIACNSNYLSDLVSISIELGLKAGCCELAAMAYVIYGIFLCSSCHNIELGYRFGKLAISMLDRSHSIEIKYQVFTLYAIFIQHWKEPIEQTVKSLQKTIDLSFISGNKHFTAYALQAHCLNVFWQGDPLEYALKNQTHQLNLLKELEQDADLSVIKIWEDLIFDLARVNPDSVKFNNDSDRVQELDHHLNAEDDRSTLFYFNFAHFLRNYFFQDLETALKYARRAGEYQTAIASSLSRIEYYFYHSLCLLSQYPASTVTANEFHLERDLIQVDSHQTQLEKSARFSPINFQHKYQLVEAEKARVLGQYWHAIESYEQAIQGAKAHHCVQDEALAYELAAGFYLARGMEKIAQTYFRESRYSYTRWQAEAKVAQLDAKYPQLLAQLSTSSLIRDIHKTTTTPSPQVGLGQALDLNAVMRASQAISREIVLDRLLSELMKVLIENMGAQVGFLILRSPAESELESGELRIEATGKSNGEITVLQSQSLMSEQPDRIDVQLPLSIINYVLRTQESVVLDCADREGPFINDPYIQTAQVKSVLCSPLIDRGQAMGAIYLENNLTTGAFSHNRLEFMQLLSGQAAISIANAKLYAKVRENQKQITQFLDAIPTGVLVTDASGKPYYINQAGQEIFGQDFITLGDEIQLDRFYQAGTDRAYHRECMPLFRAIAGEDTKADDLEIRHADRNIPLEVSATPIYNKLGEITHAIATFTDITERKQAETVLADYNQTLEQDVHTRTLELEQEIAERKRIEEALRLSEEKFSKAFLSSPSAITITDLADGRHLEANETFCVLTGYTPDEIIGRTAAELNLWVNAEDRAYLFKLIQASGIVRNYEFEFRIKSGETRTALLSTEVISLRGKKCLLSISNDITQRKKAERSLQQKNQELAQTLQQLETTQDELIQAEKMASLGQLIAGVAHEINTPMGAIRASIGNISRALENSMQQLPQLFQTLSLDRQADFFKLLAISLQKPPVFSSREERQRKRAIRKELDSLQVEEVAPIADYLAELGIERNIDPWVPLLQDRNCKLIVESVYNLATQHYNSENIKLAVERATKIVFSLKSYARQNDLSGQAIPSQITDGIDLVLTIYQHHLQQGIQLQKHYEEIPPICCYPEALNQVWTNLIHNAIQAMHNQGTLEITVTRSDDFVRVQVTDSGEGIPPEVQPKIFEPFFTTKPRGEGSGLGLDIVRKIIDKHQGRIEVESQPGQTTFSVWLPVL